MVPGTERLGLDVVMDDRRRVSRVDHQRRWVGERQYERTLWFENPVDLSEYASQIGSCGEGMDRDDDVEYVRLQKGEFGKIGDVELDVYLCFLGARPCMHDLVRVGLDGHDSTAARRHRNCAVAGAGAQIEYSTTVELADQSPIEAGHVARAELDDVGRAIPSRSSSGGVPGPCHGTNCTLGPVKEGLAQAAANSAGGSIDYRLARERVIQAYLSGEATRSEVCDAQDELMRNARECGASLDAPCPICHDVDVVQVTYIFGPRLPAAGRCMVTKADYERIRRRKGDFTAYDVEVCPACKWNHLLRTNPVV